MNSLFSKHLEIGSLTVSWKFSNVCIKHFLPICFSAELDVVCSLWRQFFLFPQCIHFLHHLFDILYTLLMAYNIHSGFPQSSTMNVLDFWSNLTKLTPVCSIIWKFIKFLGWHHLYMYPWVLVSSSVNLCLFFRLCTSYPQRRTFQNVKSSKKE